MQGIINLTILLLCLVQISYSNSFLYVKDIDSLNLPNIKSKFYFFNDNSLPVTNLSNDDLIIMSNSQTITNFKIENAKAGSINNKKVVIYFDLSLDSLNKENAIKIITNLLNFNSPKQIEYYLICFDNLNYDFHLGEIDTFELSSILKRQEIEFISDLDYSLNFQKNNPINLLKSMSGDKEILVFTSSPAKLKTEAAILNNLNNENISLSFYDFNKNSNINFRDISTKTNGFYVAKQDSISDASKVLNANLLRYNFSEVSYQIDADCSSESSNTFQMKYYSNTFGFVVSIADSLKPRLSASPSDKNFANILPNATEIEDFLIKAENKDVYIYDIRLSNSFNSKFDLFGEIDETKDAPFLLKKGEEYPIQLKFSPTDSALVFTQIIIKSDACFGNVINVTGGFPNTPPKRKTLRIKYPDCKDTLFVNDYVNVQWEGVLPRDVVQLEYSLNNGVSWDTLAKNVVNLSYEWQVPNIVTNQGLVRVLQLWPNNIGKTINLDHLQFNGGVENPINSAFFSPDGNYIVTAANDKIVRVWNSNSGELVGEFRGHTSNVRYAVFSPNSEYIASCDETGNAIVWHAVPNTALFGEIYRQFNNFGGLIYSIDFNKFSNRLIVAYQDKTYRIYDVFNGKLIYEKNEGQSVRFAKYAPDNSYYLVGLNSGFVKMYNEANTFIKEFDTRKKIGNQEPSNQSIAHIDISPDSKLAAFTNRLSKEISVWDMESNKRKYTFYHPPSLADSLVDSYADAPKSAFFYYSDKDTILISSAGNEAIRWDLRDGDSTASFREHTSFVMSANYNFDASRVVTSSWDGYAKIWKLKERDIQMDTSDCNFVILDPNVSVDDFSFDYVMLGKSSEKHFTSLIKNVTNSTITIDSILIIGRDRNDFTLLSNSKSIKLAPNEELDVDILFIPSEIGERTASLEIYLPAKKTTKSFSGFAYAPNIQRLNDTIDFGNIVVAESKELNNIPLIRNLNINSVNVDSIKIYGLDYDKFTYLSDNLAAKTLFAQKDLICNLNFQADTLGKFNSILKVYHNDETQTSKFLISGNSVPPRIDTLGVQISSQDVINNQIVDCPISVKKISSLGIIETISGFTIKLSYNKTMLEPLFPFNKINDIGDIRTIEFNVNLENRDNLLNANAVLTTLQFRVGLGKTTFSDVSILNVFPIGEGKIVLSWEGGRYTLSDICKEGGVRLIDTEGKFELSQNFPNPVNSSTNIEFEIIEKGQTSLYILDLNGNKVKEFINSEIPIGRYNVNLDLADIPNGTYFYVLETKNMKDIKRIIINK